MGDEYDASYRELLQWRANDVADKSLESTRRMRGLIDKSKDVGDQMLHNLDEQKAKLSAVDGRVAEVTAHLAEADANLSRAECCGACPWPWKMKPSIEKSSNDEERLHKIKKRSSTTGLQEHPNSHVDSEYITRITHDSREDEMEENLQYVHGGVSDLRNFGLLIKSEVLAQNTLISDIADKEENNIALVKNANRRTEKIFK